MKTILTTITFAFAVMVFAFTATPSYANEETNRKTKNAFTKPAEWIKCNLAGEGRPVGECNQELREHFSQLDPETRDVVVAYMGARFCLVYPEAEICNNNWWNLEENEGKVASLSDDELEEKLAGAIDYCKKQGNCMMLGVAEESEIASTRSLFDYERSLCDTYPQIGFLCGGNDWWNEDADSKDGEGGRNVADSGDEGSTSAAGATEQ